MALFGPRQPPRVSRDWSAGRTSAPRRSSSCQATSGHRPSRCSGKRAPQRPACAVRPSSIQLYNHARTREDLQPLASEAAKHAAAALEEAGRRLQERAAVLLGPWHPQLQQLQQLLTSQVRLLQVRCEHFPVTRACFEAWAKTAAHARSEREKGTTALVASKRIIKCEQFPCATSAAVLLQRCLGRWREALNAEHGKRPELEAKAGLQRHLRHLRVTRGLNSAGNLAWAAFRLWVRGASARRLEAARKELAQWKQRAEALDAESAGQRRAHLEATAAMAERLYQMRRSSSGGSGGGGSSSCSGSVLPCLRCYFHAWKGEVITPTQLPAPPFMASPADFFEGCLPGCQLSAVQVLHGEESEAERSLLEEHLASNERCLRVLEAWAEGLEASLLRACICSWAAASRPGHGDAVIQAVSVRGWRHACLTKTFAYWVCDHMLLCRTGRLKVSASEALLRHREAQRLSSALCAWSSAADAAKRDRALAGAGRRGLARRNRRQLAWAEGMRCRASKLSCMSAWSLLARHTRRASLALVREASWLQCCFLSAFAAFFMAAWALAVRRQSFSAACSSDICKEKHPPDSGIKALLQQRIARPLLAAQRPAATAAPCGA
eukprot:TRINITY_DN23512_c0_g1_i2.p1 TRINITY_DN23512_c0_g1~~TRINITY_DN23512_c0_g1_i2.p1  ORF type:complete len:609 (-),score=125.95 TRINITY_DN23512_c0_g1_i2:224-2050(-)